MEEESGFLENNDMEYDDCAIVMYMPNLLNNQAKAFLTLWLIFLLSHWYRSLKCQIHLHLLQQVGHEPCEFPESLLLVDRIMPFLLSPYIGTDNGNASFRSLYSKGHTQPYLRSVPRSLCLSSEISVRNCVT